MTLTADTTVHPKDAAPLATRPWTKHYDRGVPATLDYPSVPLNALLRSTVQRSPNATATIFFGAKRTYASLYRDVRRFAAGLQRLGVRKGDRVAVMLPNCPQFLIAFWGALEAGASVVPTNPLYTPREVEYQLADSGAETIVVMSRLYPVVKQARAGTRVRNVIVTNIKEEMPPVLRLLFTIAKEKKDGHRQPFRGDRGAVAFPDLLAAAEPTPVEVAPNDVAVLQYTGGTTGVPKGAMLSHRALVANTLQSRAWFTNLEDGRGVVMAVMPLFHVYGLTVAMLLAVQSAAALILEPQFELEHVLKDVEKYRPDTFPGAPRIYNAIINSPLATKYDLRSIKACISGSAPLMVETAKKFGEMTGGHLVEGYGLTEAAPVTHCNPLFGEGTQKIGSIGVPFPDVEAKIVDLETGERDLPVGEVGELVLRGPQLMDGYYQKVDETAQTLRNGWLYTGDIAKVDEDGYFYIVDRKKEMIDVSGYNVYPREVEEVLATHPAVMEAAAIGVPHPIKGEEVKAFVVLKPGATATEDELIAHCREGLAPFKVPKHVEFRETLPKSLIGKVLRRQLAEEEKAKRANVSA
ncbi:MAG: long-chain fatty acid--CoA ligase [Chloroflexota bacterium]|nr:long-chain fatty acid--CoA ligase [Chloroflexota bacterium]MDE3193744.1 long-chain fatty acid--CoA ligase [Chloroflexota bacterium]